MLQRQGLYSMKLVALVFCLLCLYVYYLSDVTSNYFLYFTSRKSSVFIYPNNTVFEETKEGYNVWSPSCRIPDVDPFHSSIKDLIKPFAPLSCTKKPFLTGLIRESDGNHTLVLFADRKHHYVKSHQEIKCCYSLITRQDFPNNTTKYKEADNAYNITECQTFSGNVTFSKEEQFLKVQCKVVEKSSKKKSKVVYNNVYAFIRRTRSVQEKIQNYVPKSQERPLSIYFIGIDSVSRINIIRSMPKTYKYISNNDWIEMKGYNKIDDNTLPNLAAILTGMTLTQVTNLFWKERSAAMDNIPFIWKNFSDIGYVTGYAEDEPAMSSFNYQKSGFVKTPTDHYIRPCMLVAYKYLDKRQQDSLDICLGPTVTSDLILDYAIDFANEYKDHPTFSLYWLNNFSHNNVNGPSMMDARFKTFFERFEKTGVFNHSLVIFLSDHGMRFGKIRQTWVGWLEERLPFIFFHFPDWWKKQNPDKYKNLLTNTKRLSSPYDLHLTLRELHGTPEEGTLACPNCTSLFNPLPWNRTCAESGITHHWCTCTEYREVKHHGSPVKAMAKFILNEINKISSNVSKSLLQHGSSCATLSMKRIMSVRSKVYSRNLLFNHQEYVILIETHPGGGLFESTIQLNRTFQIMDTISRLNSYGSQSKCIVNSAYLKKYCFCQYKK